MNILNFTMRFHFLSLLVAAYLYCPIVSFVVNPSTIIGCNHKRWGWQNQIQLKADSSSSSSPMISPNNIDIQDPGMTPKLSSNSKEEEFKNMFDQFKIYTDRDVQSLSNQRYRSLFKGVLAVTTGSTDSSSSEKQSSTKNVAPSSVFRAISILYEDYLPVRIAGRMIFGHLKNLMDESIASRKIEEERIIKNLPETKLNKIKEEGEYSSIIQKEIDLFRKAFEAMKESCSVDAEADYMTLDQMVDSGIVETAIEVLGFHSYEDFMSKLDGNNDGKLTFEEFIIGLQNCDEYSNHDDEKSPPCKITSVLDEIEQRMESEAKHSKSSSSPLLTSEKKLKKYNDRFDEMIVTFAEWEQTLSSAESHQGVEKRKTKKKDGRIWEVLQGCFDGAKVPAIVDALKIVYVDYSALRIVGDLIFKLCKRLMHAKH